MNQLSLYTRLGGYRAISNFVKDLLPRMIKDSQLGRFWAHSNSHNLTEKKLRLIGYLCTCAGWPNYHPSPSPNDIKVNELDWSKFMIHLGASMEAQDLSIKDREEVTFFLISLKTRVVKF